MGINENTMKFNKRKSLIVIAMFVLLAVLIAMSGMTFARYISSKEVPTQSATVAKWGFVVSADADALFGSDYKGTTLATVVANTEEQLSVSAESAAEGQTRGLVVAPGTTGSMTFSITGEAEVRAQITVSMTNVQDVYLTHTTTPAEG